MIDSLKPLVISLRDQNEEGCLYIFTTQRILKHKKKTSKIYVFIEIHFKCYNSLC